jgi:hypothetical protein
VKIMPFKYDQFHSLLLNYDWHMGVSYVGFNFQPPNIVIENIYLIFK